MSADLDRVYREARERVWQATDGRCWYCGDRPSVYLRTIDHVIPRCLGGGESDRNLVAACHQCNSTKGADDVETFRTRMARYRAGWPHFTKLQLDWLLARGALQEPPRYEFFGETLGLQRQTEGKPMEHPSAQHDISPAAVDDHANPPCQRVADGQPTASDG